MNTAMHASTFVNQEPSLPENNQEVINMLGLSGYSESNTGKLMDDIVMKLDLDAFTITPFGEPLAPTGLQNIQGYQQSIGNHFENYQSNETISYVDLSPVSPYSIKNSPYHVSESSLLFNECNSQPVSPQEVSSSAHTIKVENQDTSTQAGGKISRRKREPKVKLYEREEPMSDPEEEKKRMNAINAKKNRDKQKTRLQELETLVKTLTAERDTLKATNTKVRNKCDAFEKQLKTVCEQFNVPVIILPQD